MKTDSYRDEVQILIVEDSPTQAERLKGILAQHGYGFSVARNGREALASIQERPPTLVISDIRMPEMDGYELCRRIKDEQELKRIPVILLTSLSDPSDVVKGLESGADSFIFKPYDEQYLLARIGYTLTNRHLRERGDTQMGVEVVFGGRTFFITSDRLQILNLLLSTYEAAVQKNRELTVAQDELRHLNEHLESKVRERTSALELEITERKRAEQQILLQATALETAASGILITNRAGAIFWINRAFTALTGYAPEEIIGRNPSILKSGKHDREFYKKLWATILKGKT